jgi:hypothetical protein
MFRNAFSPPELKGGSSEDLKTESASGSVADSSNHPVRGLQDQNLDDQDINNTVVYERVE